VGASFRELAAAGAARCAIGAAATGAGRDVAAGSGFTLRAGATGAEDGRGVAAGRAGGVTGATATALESFLVTNFLRNPNIGAGCA